MGKFIDLTGKKFSRLTVISRAENDKHGKARWNCKCECGNECIVGGQSLIREKTKSCGCLHVTADILGRKFGKLTVIDFAGFYVGKDGKRQSKCKCKCDCGNEVIVLRSYLKKGHTTSCGCNRYKKGINTKHGHSGTRLYRIYNNIKSRCTNANTDNYKWYGKKGIKMCSEWKNDFQAFYDWSMSNGYTDELTIDRIDVSGNYEPDNCRWITQKEQCYNRKSNNIISFNGKSQTMQEWSDELGINLFTLSSRIHESKWSIEKALTTPVKKRNK